MIRKKDGLNVGYVQLVPLDDDVWEIVKTLWKER